MGRVVWVTVARQVVRMTESVALGLADFCKPNIQIIASTIYYMDDNPLLITISGPPAVGTSTIAEKLSETLGLDVVSGGDIFRDLAEEKGLTVAELNSLSETDDSIDKELDQKLQDIIKAYINGDYTVKGDGLVIESRLAGWHTEDVPSTSVLLTAPIDVRSNRISDRDETVEQLREREESEAKRYKQYYEIDITDTSVYDVCIDTETNSPEEVVEKIEAVIQ